METVSALAAAAAGDREGIISNATGSEPGSGDGGDDDSCGSRSGVVLDTGFFSLTLTPRTRYLAAAAATPTVTTGAAAAPKEGVELPAAAAAGGNRGEEDGPSTGE